MKSFHNWVTDQANSIPDASTVHKSPKKVDTIDEVSQDPNDLGDDWVGIDSDVYRLSKPKVDWRNATICCQCNNWYTTGTVCPHCSY